MRQTRRTQNRKKEGVHKNHGTAQAGQFPMVKHVALSPSWIFMDLHEFS
jgi:hypothetical protein